MDAKSRSRIILIVLAGRVRPARSLDRQARSFTRWTSKTIIKSASLEHSLALVPDLTPLSSTSSSAYGNQPEALMQQ